MIQSWNMLNAVAFGKSKYSTKANKNHSWVKHCLVFSSFHWCDTWKNTIESIWGNLSKDTEQTLKYITIIQIIMQKSDRFVVFFQMLIWANTTSLDVTNHYFKNSFMFFVCLFVVLFCFCFFCMRLEKNALTWEFRRKYSAVCETSQ